MITPTNPTVASNTYVGWERTNAIANLGNYFSEYYLGWMYYDNIPSMFHATEFLTSENTLVARDITSQANAPVAYITAPNELNTIRATYYGDFTVNSEGNTPCYLNGIYAQSVNMRYNDGSVTSTEGFGIAVYREYGSDESLGTYQQQLTFTGRQLGLTNFALLLDFLRGDSDITFTASIGGQNIEITLNATDLTDGYTTITGTQNGVFYRAVIGIYQYGISTGSVIPPSTGTGGQYQILPTLKISSLNGDYWITSQSGLTAGFIFNSDDKIIMDYSNIKMGAIGYYGGFNFTLQLSQLNDIMQTDWAFVVAGNTVLQHEDSYYRYWYSQRFYTPLEVLHHFALCIRISKEYNSPFYGYTENSWCPEVLDNGEFTGNLLNGNLTEDDVQPWQWTNINVNTFTEDDVPEYTPTPSGDEDEESGQSIPIQRRLSMGAVSSFITCYGLTASQVQEFGKKLWSSWVDNGGLVMAMVENFKFLIDSGIASNTGSIDISSVLDFVVSLKVYPCDLTHLFAFSNNGMNGKVYIGRGTYGLEVSNTAIYKAINQIGYLDAGTYNVPKPFGDFRDYTNINITVYVPYCGTIELNPADVIGRTLSGTYVVDVTTGECTFYLEVYAVTDSGEHRYVVGTCDGQLGVTIPVSATNSGQIAARRFSDVAQFATTVGGFFNRNMQIGNDIAMQMATLGASGMASKNPEMASAREQNIKMTGSQAYADNALGLLKDVTGQFGNSLTRAAIDAPNISGGSGIASFANPDCVWIQIRHGIYPTVNNYDHTVGKVSTKSAPLSSYHGFTVCHNVDVSSLPCTEEEKSAIKQLLETGVYL